MRLKPKHWGALIGLLWLGYFAYLGNKPTKIYSDPFPSADYSKGRPVGYNFKTKDYNYYKGSARDQGISIPQPKKQYDPTLNELIEQYIEDNKDEILDHLQN